MDRGAWWAAVHGVTKSQARLSDSYLLFIVYALMVDFIIFKNNYLLLAELSPHCCMDFSLVAVEMREVGAPLRCGVQASIAGASLVAEDRL